MTILMSCLKTIDVAVMGAKTSMEQLKCLERFWNDTGG